MVLLTEEKISIADLATEQGVSASTAWRWGSEGARGVKLETFAIGGRRYTTRQAFVRFVEASTAAASGPIATRIPAPSRPALAARR